MTEAEIPEETALYRACACGCGGSPAPGRKFISRHNFRAAPLRERLLSQLIIDPSGCLVWMGQLDQDGYGLISVNGKTRRVHRVMWEMFEGPIPSGLQLDHVKARGCVYRNCANIAHLEPVTSRENTMRGDGPAAVNADREECVNGHPFDLINTYWPPDGTRECRACRRERKHRYKAAAS